MDDLNYQLKVSAKPDVDSGLNVVEQRFGKMRSTMERPIESRLDFDTKSIELVERSWAKIKKSFESPLKLQVDSSAIEAATKRMAAAGGRGNSNTPAAPRGLGVAPVDSPSFVARRFAVSQRDDFEKRVRDAEAGIIRGMDKRAKIQEEIAKRDRAELEARGRLGLFVESKRPMGREISIADMARGDIEGPAVRGRFRPVSRRLVNGKPISCGATLAAPTLKAWPSATRGAGSRTSWPTSV